MTTNGTETLIIGNRNDEGQYIREVAAPPARFRVTIYGETEWFDSSYAAAMYWHDNGGGGRNTPSSIYDEQTESFLSFGDALALRKNEARKTQTERLKALRPGLDLDALVLSSPRFSGKVRTFGAASSAFDWLSTELPVEFAIVDYRRAKKGEMYAAMGSYRVVCDVETSVFGSYGREFILEAVDE